MIGVETDEGTEVSRDIWERGSFLNSQTPKSQSHLRRSGGVVGGDLVVWCADEDEDEEGVCGVGVIGSYDMWVLFVCACFPMVTTSSSKQGWVVCKLSDSLF